MLRVAEYASLFRPTGYENAGVRQSLVQTLTVFIAVWAAVSVV